MIFTIFAILIAVEIIISYKCLTVTDYKIKSDKIQGNDQDRINIGSS